jgi:hypothetical protein
MIAVAILKELGPISLRTMMMVRSKPQSLHVGCEARKPAVGTRKNILISGGTSTGKTTFLDALVREIGPDERPILVEYTPEIIVEPYQGRCPPSTLTRQTRPSSR